MSLSTPPKGSLEELFRHHLLESEAAAVPPRPHVWEQLDNSLLLAQNEKYRRRLLVHRWAVAASLTLAMLAGGGWWHSQQQTSAPTLARATSIGPETLRGAGRSVARPDYPSPAADRIAPGYLAGASAVANTPAVPIIELTSSSSGIAIDQTVTFSSTRSALAGVAPIVTGQRARLAASYIPFGISADAGRDALIINSPHSGSSLATTYSRRAASTAVLANADLLVANTSAMATADTQLALATTSSSATSLAPEPVGFATAGLGTTALDALATRPAQLALAGTSLPSSLGALPQPELPVPTIERRWQLGVTYAASVFQPNIDFAKTSASYKQTLGANSAFVTQNAAAEYRSHLRAGLGQRLSMWATRRLGNGRFGLRTGLEVAQNTAYSASSVAFVGEQVADVNYLSYTNTYAVIAPKPAQLRTTSYRYRTASVPVEVQYTSNPIKAGFSFYGRLGGVFSALLSIRSDVDDNSEATRTYTLTSAGSPYRHLSANLRGGAGVHYKPTNHQWGVSLGPVAEAGIFSLNADPAQDFWSQKRPYSFGLEAGVELGRAPRVP